MLNLFRLKSYFLHKYFLCVSVCLITGDSNNIMFAVSNGLPPMYTI